jgi:mannose-6-phosphate isomerase-like protein (cupin superfamily)
VFFPQIHQVLPRLARLMVALRAELLGPLREECSFLFLADGRGREGMGLHHDGEVDAFWLQLEGRRTITLGPPVPRGTPEDLAPSYAREQRARPWSTLELEPGTLFYMPPRTPHRVVYFERSAAVSLTWGRRSRRGRGAVLGLTDWDVVSGRADRLPPTSRARLWTQVPAAAGPIDRRRGEFPLWLPDGGELRLPAAVHPLAAGLVAMPWWRRPPPGLARDHLAILIAQGLVGPRDLPLRIIPTNPRALDGWRFA